MPIYLEKEKINGQKRYYIRTYITDESGKRKQITRHCKDWTGKSGYWKACQEEVNMKSNAKYTSVRLSLDKLYNDYIDYVLNVKKLKISSITKIKDNYRLYIEPFFTKNCILNDLSNKEILNWHDWLIKNKNLSLKFNRNIHTTLVTMLNHACKFYNLEKNVASICGNFEIPKGSKKKEMNFMTVDEFNIFIEQETNIIYKCFFTILFYTGMRLGELWCLKWDDIDFNEKTITINKSYNPKNGGETDPKTNKSNRVLKISEQAFDSIVLMRKFKNNHYIFGVDKITGTTLRRKCANNYKKVNSQKKLRVHDFRHSFASMCINNKVPIEIISDYLGHENVSTTLDIYGHLYPNSQNVLVSTLDEKEIIEKNKKQDFRDYIFDIVNKCLISDKSKEEILLILSNIEKCYLPKQDQIQDQIK